MMCNQCTNMRKWHSLRLRISSLESHFAVVDRDGDLCCEEPKEEETGLSGKKKGQILQGKGKRANERCISGYYRNWLTAGNGTSLS